MEDCFSPIERAIREVCHTRKIPQPDIWEEKGVYTAELHRDSEFRADYIKVGDEQTAPECLMIGRFTETSEGDIMSCVRVTHAYVKQEPVIIAIVDAELPHATNKGRKQQAQMEQFIQAANALVGVYNGRKGKDEVDMQLRSELVGAFYDLIEVAQMYLKPVEGTGLPPFSEN